VNKKQKIQGIVILSTILLAVLGYYFNPLWYLAQEFGKLDSELKHILTTIVMASLAGLLFAFKNKTKGELFAQFEAMELLILIVIPSVVSFSYIVNDLSNYSLAVAFYVGSVMVWFVIVITRHKPISDSKKERIFTIKISYFLAVLLAYGFFVFWQLNTFNQLLAQAP
jgi:hypothetical protein